MPGINYAINGCSPLRTSPGEIEEEKHCWRKSTVAVVTRGWVIYDNLKKKIIKNWTLYTCRLFKSILAFTHPLPSIYIAR